MEARTRIIYESPYELVAQAIIKRAMADYKAALRQDNHGQIAELEKFFRGSYGQTLSWNHGEQIIEYCKQTVDEAELEEGEADGEETD